MADKKGTVLIYQAIQPDGSALWPEQRPINWLMNTKSQMVDAYFDSQYQNDPRGLKGVLFNLDHLQYYLPEELPPIHQLIGFQGGDSAVSKESTADFYGHCTAARGYDGTLYILDFAHERFSSPEHMGFLKSEHDKWRLKGLVIQTVMLEYWGSLKGAGQELLERNRAAYNPLPLELIEQGAESVQTKQNRLMSLRPHFNGRMLFPGEYDGKGGRRMVQKKQFQDFVAQFSDFPRGKYDDMLDALWVVCEAAFGHAMAAISVMSPQDFERQAMANATGQTFYPTPPDMSDEERLMAAMTANALDYDEPRDHGALKQANSPAGALYGRRGHIAALGRHGVHPAMAAHRRRAGVVL